MSKTEKDEEIVHLASNEEGDPGEVDDTPNNQRISTTSLELPTRPKTTPTKPINNLTKKNNEIDREECGANMAAQKLTPIQNLPRNNNRVFKSPVRPFFCCGSQLSLNSVSEFIELEQSTSDKEETEFTDLSDCDEVTDLMANLAMHNRGRVKSGTKCRTGGCNLKKTNGQGKGNVRRKFWTLRFKAKLSVPKRFRSEDEAALQEPCVCTTAGDGANASQDYTSAIGIGANRDQQHGAHASQNIGARSLAADHGQRLQEFFLLAPVNFDELYPTEDIDERRIAQRRREMEEGIEMSDIWVPQSVQIGGATGPHDLSLEDEDYDDTFLSFQTQNHRDSSATDYEESLYGECSFPIPCNVFSRNSYVPQRAHSTVDYIHCLVPDILQITKCSYYWGVMDRYQAEKLLDKKPEGTFLLRDSAQDDYLFSVSFRRYGRSLHARIEQWNHKFSFDSHDPGVFASDTVCGLIEHYKDPSCCMFFEPMLTLPLHRNMPFSLQHLCRATISNYVNYDSINQLPLPKTLREFMRYYHYKQKIRVRRHDGNLV